MEREDIPVADVLAEVVSDLSAVSADDASEWEVTDDDEERNWWWELPHLGVCALQRCPFFLFALCTASVVVFVVGICAFIHRLISHHRINL